jgi:hypothetical protein
LIAGFYCALLVFEAVTPSCAHIVSAKKLADTSKRPPNKLLRSKTTTLDGHGRTVTAGQYDVDYACSLAGVFNLSGALCHLYGRNELEQTFDVAQELIVCLIREERAPTDDEGQSLAEAFNLADAWITMQNTASLMKAVDYVERELINKKTGWGI